MAGKTYAEKLVQSSTGREVDDLLRELYVEKKYSQEEIARALGVSRGAIVSWLTKYDISRDDREPLDPLVAA